jgi:hypothetical protein
MIPKYPSYILNKKKPSALHFVLKIKKSFTLQYEVIALNTSENKN